LYYCLLLPPDNCSNCSNTRVVLEIGYENVTELNGCPPMVSKFYGNWNIDFFYLGNSTNYPNAGGWYNGAYVSYLPKFTFTDCELGKSFTLTIKQEGYYTYTGFDGSTQTKYYQCYQKIKHPGAGCNKTAIIKTKLICGCR